MQLIEIIPPSPPPWRVANDPSRWSCPILAGPENETRAIAHMDAHSYSENLANACRIVYCVNNFDDLWRLALDMMSTYRDDNKPALVTVERMEAWQAVLNKIRQANPTQQPITP